MAKNNANKREQPKRKKGEKRDLPKGDKSKGASRDDLALRRRKFIRERVENYGFVTDAAIREEGERVGFPSPAFSLKKDHLFFEALGLKIRREGNQFVQDDDRRSSYEIRKDKQKEEKLAIAYVANELLWAHQPEKRPEALQHLWSGKSDKSDTNIRLMLGVAKVRQILDDYWTKSHRVVALDSGTTTLQIATELTNDRNEAERLSNLRVVSNSPDIEGHLQRSGKQIDVIGIGGLLRKDTSARTGLLSEMCLKAWNMRFDVAFVGATGLGRDDERPMAFASDSEEEARTKAMLLELATLRIIVIDSSKCIKRSSSSITFGAVDSRLVDMVITDDRFVNDGPKDQEKTNRFNQCCNHFRERGIVVIQAPILKDLASDKG